MKDIILDTTHDIRLTQGDLTVGTSELQHQEHIILASKGEYKARPEVGVGIVQMIADDRYTELLIDIKKQLEYDGMRIDDVALRQGGKLFVEGKYMNQ